MLHCKEPFCATSARTLKVYSTEFFAPDFSNSSTAEAARVKRLNKLSVAAFCISAFFAYSRDLSPVSLASAATVDENNAVADHPIVIAAEQNLVAALQAKRRAGKSGFGGEDGDCHQ